MELDLLFNVPRVVPFAGGEVRARALTLRQLGELQAWLRGQFPDPAELALDGPADAASAASAAAALADDAWPVRLGSPLGDWLLSTPAGRAELARVGLAALNPGFDPAEAAEADDGDWGRLGRVLYGADPRAALLRLIDAGPDGRDGRDGTDGGIPWGRMVCDVLRESGETLASVGDLSPVQLAALRHGGEVPGPTVRPRDGESMDDARARRRAALGLDDDEPEFDPANPEIAAQLAALALATNGGGF